MIGAIDSVFVLSNQIEAALWLLVALVITIAAIRRRAARLECAVAAIAFALFGVSDLVETTTGAWWRPWWLLAWKAACVVAFLGLLRRYVTLGRPRDGAG